MPSGWWILPFALIGAFVWIEGITKVMTAAPWLESHQVLPVLAPK